MQPQNEPGYDTRYPSCLWDAGLLSTFVGTYLGPLLAERAPNTKIWFGTLSNDQTYTNDISGLTGDALNYVSGFGLQWNTMGRIPSILGMKSDLLIMQTEHKCGNYPFTVTNPAPFQPPAFNADKPQNDHAYAMESWYCIREWIKAGVNSYSAWNMVLDIDREEPRRRAPLAAKRAPGRRPRRPTSSSRRLPITSSGICPSSSIPARSASRPREATRSRSRTPTEVSSRFCSTPGLKRPTTIAALGATNVQVQVPSQGWATVYWKG